MNGSNLTVDTPVGVDVAIKQIQNYLFKNVDWSNVSMCGRVEKIPNPEEGRGFKPRFFTRYNQYIDPMRDDRRNANAFFVLGDRANSVQGYLFQIECKIVFMVDVSKLYADIIGDNSNVTGLDQRAQDDIVKGLRGMHSTFAITSVGTGINECLGEFDTEDIKFTDIYPNHVFCITGQLSYYTSC